MLVIISFIYQLALRYEAKSVNYSNISYRGGTLTDELKNLLKVLSKVLLAVVGGWQPLVAQSRVDVVEGEVCGHIDHIADVEAQQ